MSKTTYRNLTEQKIQAFTAAAARIGCNPLHLMAVVSFETGRTFSETARNPHSSASGLIQFMAATAKNLGTDIQRVRAMSFSDQLELTIRYFAKVLPQNRSAIGLADLYMAVLWPRAVGKPMGYELWQRNGRYSKQYAANKGLDRLNLGRVTKADCIHHVVRHLKEVGEVCAFKGY